MKIKLTPKMFPNNTDKEVYQETNVRLTPIKESAAYSQNLQTVLKLKDDRHTGPRWRNYNMYIFTIWKPKFCAKKTKWEAVLLGKPLLC